jgi:hypothetical protein
VIREYGSLRKADIAYAYQDLERLEALYRNKWWMECYTLTATIEISDDGIHWGTDNLYASMGGIESDSGKDFKQEMVENLKCKMFSELEAYGFQRWEIINEIAQIKEKQQ